MGKLTKKLASKARRLKDIRNRIKKLQVDERSVRDELLDSLEPGDYIELSSGTEIQFQEHVVIEELTEEEAVANGQLSTFKAIEALGKEDELTERRVVMSGVKKYNKHHNNPIPTKVSTRQIIRVRLGSPTVDAATPKISKKAKGQKGGKKKATAKTS